MSRQVVSSIRSRFDCWISVKFGRLLQVSFLQEIVLQLKVILALVPFLQSMLRLQSRRSLRLYNIAGSLRPLTLT